MTYDLKRWRAHPGRNPAHDPNGRQSAFIRVPDPATKQLVDVEVRGPRNPSRWLPHQGAAEKARRAARMGGGNV